MPNKNYVLAIDQGTTGSTALLLDEEKQVVSAAYREVSQIYPHPGWVEQDPQELLRSLLAVAQEALQKVGVPVSQVKGWALPTRGRPPWYGTAIPESR